MNKITLKRVYHSDGDDPSVKIAYEVVKVVGSINPFVGKIISAYYVRDLCDCTGMWEVTFVKGATLTPPPKIGPLTAGQLMERDDAFDFARATNLYLLAARDLGTCLGGNSITDLLADRTGWDLDKCKTMGDRVIDDPAIIKLMQDESIPESYDNG